MKTYQLSSLCWLYWNSRESLGQLLKHVMMDVYVLHRQL